MRKPRKQRWQEYGQSEGTIAVTADGYVTIKTPTIELTLRPEDARDMAAKLTQAAEIAEAALARRTEA